MSGGGHDDDYEKLSNSSALEHGEEEGEGPWLMSFADMLVVLMCFFILFFQTDAGNIQLQNPDKLMEKLEKLKNLVGMQAENPSQVETRLSGKSAEGSVGSFQRFKGSMKKLSQKLNLVLSIGTPEPGTIELTFLNTRFFRSGEAKLTGDARQMLRAVAKKLEGLDESAIEVEGHTDSDPIRSWRYPSNWELSGARASTVVRLLAHNGISPGRMKAVGRSHFDPIVPEKRTSGRTRRENKAMNRRIVIRVEHANFDAEKKNMRPDGTRKRRRRPRSPRGDRR